MPKNIVICCDGTGNAFGEHNSNVVKLLQVAERAIENQVVFYDPGVGTMEAPEALFRATKKLTWWFGLGFGMGLRRNVGEAYAYLMEHYEEGDKVFLFGFSRGAYTARVLAGMLHKVGLLEKGSMHHVPYAFQIYREGHNFKVAAGFKKTFGRRCPIHFLGVWDTVSTVGWIYNPVTHPYTAVNRSIKIFRHAISIDERRTHFRTNLFFPLKGQDCKQVWFAGVHADIGGGYKEAESGLAKLALEWMLREGQGAGLLVNEARKAHMLPATSGPKYVKADPEAAQHDQLRNWPWRLIEHLPRRYIDLSAGIPVTKWRWAPIRGFYWSRPMPSCALLHSSVLERLRLVSTYKPNNLAQNYIVES